MKKIKNAAIKTVRLGKFERFWGVQICFNYGDGTSQCVSFCYKKIPELLEKVGVDFWELLPNTNCRVEQTTDCVSKIGHYIKDEWLTL